MNYSEVKKELKKEFEVFLKPLGYKSKSDPQGCDFLTEKLNCINRIGYGVANYIDEFNTSCYLKISLIPIQNIEGVVFDEKGIYDTGNNYLPSSNFYSCGNFISSIFFS